MSNATFVTVSMSKKRVCEDETADREQRRAKRAKQRGDKSCGTPMCRESYCKGVRDPCTNCREKVTQPRDVPSKEGKKFKWTDMCVMCRETQGLMTNAKGYAECKACIEHRAQKKAYLAIKDVKGLPQPVIDDIAKRASVQDMMCLIDELYRNSSIYDPKWITQTLTGIINDRMMDEDE